MEKVVNKIKSIKYWGKVSGKAEKQHHSSRDRHCKFRNNGDNKVKNEFKAYWM